MRHDWLVAQLDAMKRYALQNHLSELADALQTAKLVALVENRIDRRKTPHATTTRHLT